MNCLSYAECIHEVSIHVEKQKATRILVALQHTFLCWSLSPSKDPATSEIAMAQGLHISALDGAKWFFKVLKPVYTLTSSEQELSCSTSLPTHRYLLLFSL